MELLNLGGCTATHSVPVKIDIDHTMNILSFLNVIHKAFSQSPERLGQRWLGN